MRYLSVGLLNLSLGLSLIGCGGSNNQPPDPVVTESVTLAGLLAHKPTETQAPLHQVPQSTFLSHLKNGLFTATTNDAVIKFQEGVADTASTPEASTTNTQEQGVDEADRLKYDGQYFYIAARSYYDNIQTMSSGDSVMIDNGGITAESDYIKVINKDHLLEDHKRLEMSAKFASIHGMYLHHQQLAVVSSGQQFFHTIDIEPFVIPEWQQEQFRITFYDTGDDISQSHQLDIDGRLIDSRRIGNMLYLVTSFTPHIDDLFYFTQDSKQQQHNFDRIQNATLEQLLPHYRINNNDSQPLFNDGSCLIPSDSGKFDGYGNISTITAINLDQPQELQSICINTSSSDLYVSADGVFLTNNTFDQEQQSNIHFFPLQDGQPRYQASQTVNGGLGWSRPAFRMSHHNDQLRVVTTQNGGADELHHQLYVLDAHPTTGNLQTIATLPNEQQPQAIGKPGEDIYASRFFGDRAYLVTFKRIDPLYVLDLSDGSNPLITGELEIPGFSSYLHPISENYLLGIGQQVDPGDIRATEGPENKPELQEGMKISLFDITSPQAPQEVGQAVFADAYTPVEYDHHAFTSLVQDNTLKIALPIERYNHRKDQGYYTGKWLQLFEVSELATTPILIEHRAVYPSQAETSYISGSEDRSIIDGEMIYYLHGNQLTMEAWQ